MNGKILVVDDYEIIRNHLCDLLKKMNISYSIATNGLEALEKLRTESFDAVFTDIVMPVMDGFELCDEIRKSSEFFHLPIVVLSTHCDTNYIVKALRHGADVNFIVHQLEKSKGDMSSLGKAICRALKKHRENGTKITGESCPQCGQENLVRQEGCKWCPDCGYSACG